MKFKSLKFISTGVITSVLFSFMVACNNESGKDSTNTTGNENKTPDSAASTNPSTATTPKKKTGKVSTSVSATAEANAKVEKDKMGYYTNTDVLPAYGGGQDALQTYISNNIEYPQDAIDNNAEGTVNVQFVVDEHGNVSNVKTVGNKIGYGLEEEAIKVVSQMPKWTPGQVKGKYVKTWRTLPIMYRLES
jgi:periplasmic protein TonB